MAETFEFLDDWEDRYRHVIELGKAMDPLEEALNTLNQIVGLGLLPRGSGALKPQTEN